MSDILEGEINSTNVRQGKTFSGRFLILVVILGLLSGFGGGTLAARKIYRQDFSKPLATSGQKPPVIIQEESGVIDVVKKASPAVVSVVISKDLSRLPGYGLDPFNDFDFFAPFFGFNGPRQPRSAPAEPNVQKIGAGSGFFVSPDGMILTNKHVVSDEGASYTVITNDRKSLSARVLTLDPVNDLALLKVDIKGAPFLELADSGKLQIGQMVVAIGNSLGQYQNTVTTGVVSGIGRSIVAGGQDGSEQLEGVVQTDAAINPGNSGGPLLNLSGQVIGINTAIDRDGQSVGFAIPAADARKALESFKKNGRITRAYLGVRYVTITKELARSQKLPRDFGALLARGEKVTDFAVMPGSPADKAGLVENDIILEVNGKKIDEDQTLAGMLRQFSVGDSVALKIYHRGEEKTVTVVLEESK